MKTFWNYFVLFPFLYAGCQVYSPIATTTTGKVIGTIEQTVEANKTYYAYRGIPYAQPPVGDLRFAAPLPSKPWYEVRDATQDGNMCTQMNSDIVIVASEADVVGSEDCLYINVFTTSLDLNSSLSVMVFFYPGGFNTGSVNTAGKPDYLLEKDVIYITFNYRVGIFGFLSTEDSVISGNWGIKDQILALRWIKENVEYFGGDSNNITIFGQSSGAVSVAYMLSTSLTEGLYNRAIMESGNNLCPFSLTRRARENAFTVATELGIDSNNSTTLLKELRKIESKKLKLAENIITVRDLFIGDSYAGLTFGVTREAEHNGAVLTERNYEILSSGNFNKVPTLIGFVSNEVMRVNDFYLLLLLDLLDDDINPERFAPYDLSSNSSIRPIAGSEVRDHYFNSSPLAFQFPAYLKYLNVNQYIKAIREAVHLMSKYENVYYYEFSYEGEIGNSNRKYPGVGHGEELNYLFYVNKTANAEDELIRQRLLTLWTNFAKTGNPTSSDPLGVLENLNWTPNNNLLNATETVLLLNISSTFNMESNPYQEDWLYYIDLYDKYGNASYFSTY